MPPSDWPSVATSWVVLAGSSSAMFAVGEFRVLFATLLMFVLGFEFEILGLSVLVYTQTRSAFWTALAFSMGFAPQALGGALFTSLADRLPPRLVISAGLLTRAAPGLLIGLWQALPVPAMLALVAAAATATPVFTAASSAVLSDVLDGDRYVLGRSVFSVTGSATQIIGLGIGGAILAALPARRLLLAAGLALLAAAVVARLGLRTRPARTDGRTLRGDSKAGRAARSGSKAGPAARSGSKAGQPPAATAKPAARTAGPPAGSCAPPWPATLNSSPTGPCAACCSRSGCPPGSSPAPSP